MVEGYDPEEQLAVIAAVDGAIRVSIKIRLRLPTVVDTPSGIR
jgi:hypothetical protein